MFRRDGPSRGAALLAAAIFSLSIAACASTPLPPTPQTPADGVRVATYNVHYADMDDGLHAVRAHAEATVRALQIIGADLFCLQEVCTSDYPDIVCPCPFRAELERLLPDYSWIAPRGASKLGSATPILYRADRFFPICQGVEWFSPTPGIPDSTGWGNTLPRCLVWALFYDAAAHGHLLVANVHLDHLSRRANRRALDRIAGFLAEHVSRYPIVLAGDFNEPAVGTARRVLDEHLDCALTLRDGPTFSGGLPLQIDAVYYSRELEPTHVAVLRDLPASALADHAPVVVDLRPR